jgi:hypothetical protein
MRMVNFVKARDKAVHITFIDDLTIFGVVWNVLLIVTLEELLFIFAIHKITILFAKFDAIFSIALEKICLGSLGSIFVDVSAIVGAKLHA